MKKINRKLRQKLYRAVAMLLVICMLPFSAFPGKQMTYTAKAAEPFDWEFAWGSDVYGYDLEFGNGFFLTANSDGVVYKSADGKNWEIVCDSLDRNGNFLLEHYHEYFYLYGGNKKVYCTKDGVQWECPNLDNMNIYGITYAQGMYYALTGNVDEVTNAKTASLMCSQDGIDWTVLNTQIPQTEYAGLDYGRDKLVSVSKYSEEDILIMDLSGNVISDFEVNEQQTDEQEKILAIKYANNYFFLETETNVYISEDAVQWREYTDKWTSNGVEVGNDYYCLRDGDYVYHFPDVSMEHTAYNVLFDLNTDILMFEVAAGNNLLVTFTNASVLYSSIETDTSVSMETQANPSVSENSQETIQWETLTQDMTIEGDWDISGKRLDLNGHSVTVKGNLLCADSLLKMSGGQICVEGDVTVSDRTQVEGNLQVGGNLTIRKGFLQLQHAQITVAGDFCVEYTKGERNYGISLLHEDDALTVQGDMDYRAPMKRGNAAGKITIAGDVSISGNLEQGNSQTLCLNGLQKQELNITGEVVLGKLELKNTSDEGVVANKLLDPFCFETNGCQFNYGEGNTNGTLGYTLQKDEVVDGDLYLMDDVLDLNGHSLHVKGDLIQASGVIKVNGGALTVEKDYRMQYRTGAKEEEYVYETSDGILQMTTDNDVVRIKGDCYISTQTEMKECLSAGVWMIEGDFVQIQDRLFAPSGTHKTVFAQKEDGGETTHTIKLGKENKFRILQLDSADWYDTKKDVKDIAEEVIYGEGTHVPEAPELNVEGTTSKTITLTWNKDDDPNVTYEVYRKSYYSESYEKIAEGLTENRFVDEDGSIDGADYKVAAINDINLKSDYSNEQFAAYSYVYIGSISPTNRKLINGQDEGIKFRLEKKYYNPQKEYQVNLFYCLEGEEEYQSFYQLTIPPGELESYLGKYYTVPWDFLGDIEDQNVKVSFEVSDCDSTMPIRIYTYVLDRTLPEVPTVMRASKSREHIYASWEKSKSTDCAGYYVYRKCGDEEYTKILDTKDTYYHDYDVEEGKEYSYYVRAYDKTGNLSVATEAKDVYMEPDTVSPKMTLYDPYKNSLLRGDAEIDLYASDDVILKNIKVYLKDSGGEEHLLKEEETKEYSKSVRFYFDTTQYADGECQIFAVAEDAAGNVSEKVTVNCTIDNTPPEKVKNLTGEATEETITISWNSVPEQVQYYRVERMAISGESYNSTYNVYNNETTYTIKYLEMGTEYTIRVYAVDKAGNEGPWEEIKISTLKDCTPPEIQNINPSNPYSINERTSYLYLSSYVRDNGTLTEGVFSYSTDGENFTEIGRDDGGYSSCYYSYDWKLPEFEDETTVTVIFRVGDTFGNFATVKREFIVDKTAPKAPENFEAKVQEDAVYLSWEAPEDNDIRNYYIVRQNVNTNKNESFYTQDCSYVDTSVVKGNYYVYSVYAKDYAEHNGESTDTIELKIGPEIPETISEYKEAEKTCSSITLGFELNPEGTDISHYAVRRGYQDIATLSAGSTSYTDEGLTAQTQYFYEIVAYDKSGNVVESTNRLYVTTLADLIAPEPVTGIHMVKRTGSRIELAWAPATDNYEMGTYNVYRDSKKIAEGIKEERYSDLGLKQGRTYTYEICAVDAAGNVSEMSEPIVAETRVPEIISLSPQDGSVIGGEKTSYELILSNDILAGKRMVQAYYYDKEGTRWEELFPAKEVNPSHVSERILFLFQWEHSAITEEQDVEVKVIVTDIDGNATEQIVTNHLDRTGPEIPELFDVIERDTDVTISWSPSSSDDCIKYQLYGRMQGETEYVLLSAYSDMEKETYRYVHENRKQMETYEYYVEMYDVFGNVSVTNTNTIYIERDTTPPTKPSNLRVNSRTASVSTLLWEESSDNVKVSSYTIYRDGKILAEGIKETGYTDINLKPEKRYTYHVTAVDEAGNESQASDTVTVTMLLPEITGVSPKQGTAIGGENMSGEILIRNDAPAGVRKIQVDYYEKETGTWMEIVRPMDLIVGGFSGNTWFIYQWNHADIAEDGNIDVRITVTDRDGNKTENIVTYYLDRKGPGLPVSFKITEKDTNVTFTWSACEDEDCQGYRLYGKRQEEVDFTCIADVSDTGKDIYSYVLENLGQMETYEYYLQLYDKFGNVTETEIQSLYVEIDTQPPTPPTSIYTRAQTGSSITLSWGGATDNVAVKTYNLYRDGVLIAEHITGDTYKDTGLTEKTLYTYQLTALDEAGNESEISEGYDSAVCMPEIMEVIPADYSIIGGEEIEICVRSKRYGSSTGNTVQLYFYDNAQGTWNAITGEPVPQRVDGYASFRSSCKWTLPSYTEDEDVDIKILVTDEDGNTTEKTVTYTVDKTAPAAPAEMTAEESNGVIALSFTPSSSVDTEGYVVYRKGVSEEEFTEIARVSGRATGWYIDREVKTGETYIYRLSAYDTYGQEGDTIQSEGVSVSADDDPPKIKSMTPDAGDVKGTVNVRVEGSDNRAVAKVVFYMRHDEETEWTLLGEATAEENIAEYAWDTTGLADATYYIKAAVFDVAGNTNENLYQRRYKVDNTGISKIKLSECKAQSTSVQLTWEDVTEEDFDYFSVERKIGDAWVSCGKVTDKLGYIVTSLAPETTYTFRVVGYDKLGNRGEPSDETTLMTSADTIGPTITQINPVSSYYGDSMSLSMKVKDNAEVQSGVFSYSADGETYTVIEEINAKDGETETTFSCAWDTSALPEGQVTVRFEAYDVAGNHSQILEGDKQIENTYIIDHTAPAKVLSPKATGAEGYIGLTWRRSEDSDVKAYRIYRMDEAGGSYLLLREQSKINYYDESVQQGKTYYYKISAVDIAGNEGEKSACVFASAVPDTVAPVIRGLSPQNTQMLGKHATFSVLATDNAALDSVRLEYREKESKDLWQEAATSEITGNEQYVRIPFEAEGLSEDTEYEFRAVAYDKAGNASAYVSATYTFDLTAPQAPVVTTESMSYRIGISMTEAQDPDFELYEIYRKELGEKEYKCIQNTKECSYEDTTTKVNTIYYYKVRAYDAYGNYSESEVVHNYANDTDSIAPVATLAETYMSITGYSMRFDGTQSSDNVRIIKYEWNFGDGTTKTGAKPTHTYKKAGTYTVSLTVTDAAGNSDATTGIVTVLDGENNGQSIVRVIDTNGVPIAGAHVYIRTGNGENEVIRTRTNADGEANIVTKAGVYEFAAYADGYLPKEDTIRVSNYEKLSKEIVLPSGEIVTGSVTATRMTMEELVEYGVDLSEPENYNTCTFKVDLTFAESPIPVSYEFVEKPVAIYQPPARDTKGAGPCYVYQAGKGNGEIQVIAAPNDDGELEVRSVVHLSTTQSVSWLKDMYNVNLNVINHADSSFPIEQASATLSLPEGLSLAQTASGQTLTTQMGTIEGQSSADAHWIVRGDKNGTYDITAAFHGILMPFGVSVDNVFTTQQEFAVKSGEGLHILIQPEESLYYGSKYYIQFTVKNNSDREFYNLKTTLGEYIEPAEMVQMIVKDRETGTVTDVSTRISGKTYHSTSAAKCSVVPVLYDGDTVEIGVFSPGEEIRGTYVTKFTGKEGMFSETYNVLVDSFVEMLEGENLGVEVEVEPISSHLYRYIYYTAGSALEPDEEEVEYGDPVDAATGAFTQQINALSVTGASTLELSLNYNSMLAGKQGECGYGWSHSYEQKISDIGGVIELYSSPYSVVSFVSKELDDGVVYGYQSGDKVILDDEAEYLGTYVATGSTMKGATIEKKADGDSYIYELTDMAGTVCTFDAGGNLIKSQDINGKSISFTRGETEVSVTDDISGETLVMTYTDGRMTGVSDDHGRICRFAYDESGDLISYTDALGQTTTFAYDDAHHMEECKNPAGTTVVENTFDEEGRTLTQKEAGSDKKSVFAYEDTQDGGVKIQITKRDESTLTYVTDKKGNIIKETDEMGQVSQYLYSSRGDVLDETAPDGSRTMYEYDEDGNMTASYDTAGNVTSYIYDDKHNPVQVTSPDGLTSTYKYDDKNRLTSYTTPLGVATTYEYDTYGNLVKETTPGLGEKTYTYENGRKISTTDYNGNVTKYTYDAYGNLASVTDPLGNKTTSVYDAEGNVLSETDAAGVVTTYTYDKSGNKLTETIGDVTTHYAYDKAGRLSKLVNAAGDETLYTYDTEGNVTSITYPDKTKSTYVYDAKGRVIKETDPDGSIHVYTYDTMGFLVSETHAGITTEYTYYPNGKLRTESFADGTENTYTYDANWNMISVMDQDKHTTTYTYDAMAHVTSVTDALGNQVTYTYDANGRRIKETNPRGYETTYTYDGNGNCIKTQTPDGTIVTYDYDANGNVTKAATQTAQGEIAVTYKYDKKGRLIETTDALGNVTKVTYDIYGNVEKVTDALGNVVEENTYDVIHQLIQTKDAIGSIATYAYDKSGNVTKAVAAAGTNSASSYTYAYDKAGRILSSTDPLSGVSKYTYNEAGQVSSVIDPMGGVTQYKYDELCRVTEVVSPINTSSQYTYNAQGLLETEKNARGQDRKYTYDAIGRIKKVEDALGTISYTYDANSNILTVTEKQGIVQKTITRTFDCMNRVESYTDCNGKTIKYAYDELGNRISLTYPGGEIVRYSYDKNGKLLSVTDHEGGVANYEYDKNGKLIKTKRPDGSTETFTYNAAGHLTEQKDVAADGSEIHHYTYSYDAQGNITEMEGKEQIDTSLLKNAVMTYDADNRLVTYNGEAVTYDADGNMLHGPLDGAMADFTYDCRNRLVEVKDADENVTKYEYDAENTRIAEYNDEEKSKTVYVTDKEAAYSQLLTETVYTKNLLGLYAEEGTTLYTYGAGLVSEHTETETLYYHYNNIGSTTEVTSEDGEVEYRFVYGTYGELLGIFDSESEPMLTVSDDLRSVLEEVDIRFLYNGQLGVQTDKNTLYYMRARYYNTDIKRFINRDIVDGSIANSQSLNKYSYVQGNPIKLTDPFGLSPVGGDPYSVFSAIGHSLLDVAGIFFDGADVINALWYAAEGNTFMAATSALSALPFLGNLVAGGLKIGFKGSKVAAKAGKFVTEISRFTSHSAQAIMSTIDSCYAAKDYKQAKAAGESGNVEMLQLGLSFAGALFSAGGAARSGKNLKNLLSGDKPAGAAISGIKHGVAPEVAEEATKCNCGKQVTVNGKKQWQCFVAGTLIKTADGEKAIEEIKPGDKVYAKDTETGEEGYKEVVRLYVSEKDELVHVRIGDVQIDTTPEHPFWVDGKGFIDAEHLKVGDRLLTAEGELERVTFVSREQLKTPVAVYNFEVKDWHTYYVSEEEILVHNQCGVEVTPSTSGGGLMHESGTKTNYAQSRGNTFNSSYNIPTDGNGYTKSNFKLGQDVHKEYKQNEVDDLVKFKEYRLPSKKRIDFIDFETKTIYELKPYNPNQIKKGNKQLEGYLREVESLFGAGWTTVLDTY